jgi:sigma-B regulation protein RsbU (phosphoserine phosphatase)
VPSAYQSTPIPFGSGDRLVIYTDGVLEATNRAGEFFGDERFHRVVSAHAQRSAADLARAIADEMMQWIAPRQGFDDDVTIVVVEVV